MYRLHGFGTQNNKKVVYLLEELELDYELKIVNLFKGESRTPEFKALNPFGKAPVLETEEGTVFESGAICRFLGNSHSSDLYPTSPFQRAQVDAWIDSFSIQAGRWLSGLYFELVLKPRPVLAKPTRRVRQVSKIRRLNESRRSLVR